LIFSIQFSDYFVISKRENHLAKPFSVLQFNFLFNLSYVDEGQIPATLEILKKYNLKTNFFKLSKTLKNILKLQKEFLKMVILLAIIF